MIEQAEQGVMHNLWVGDFNRHHPHWDNPSDTRLFMREALNTAEILIEVVAEAGLEMALPSSITTHIYNVMKKWSRLDQVFLSKHSENLLITCNTQMESRGINMDHLPIRTELSLEASTIKVMSTQNFREVDWEEFGKVLERHLAELQPPTKITMQRQLDKHCSKLTTAIQSTMSKQVPMLCLLRLQILCKCL